MLFPLALAFSVMTFPLAASSAAGHQSAKGTAGSSRLTLVSQTTIVEPGQDFDIQLTVQPGSAPRSALGIAVSSYDCLGSTSALQQSIGGSEEGVPATTSGTVPLDSLGGSVGGVINLKMPVQVDVGTPASATDPFPLDLVCNSPYGVFPLGITLRDIRTGTTEASLVTQVLYDSAATGTTQLRFAWVLPVDITPQLATSPQAIDPASVLASPMAGAVNSWSAVAKSVAAAGVPVTLAVVPQTVQALDAGSKGQGVVATLQSLSDGTTDEIVGQPYVVVDSDSLVKSDVPGALADQWSRGAAVLNSFGIRTTDDTEVLARALDPNAATQLEALGFDHFVVPSSDVTGTADTVTTPSQPFSLDLPRQSTSVSASTNPDLDGIFAAAATEPVLAAHQLLAFLAQIYFEAPYDVHVRSVVATPPPGWTPNPTFVTTLLAGLDGNPIVAPETLATLFGSATATAGAAASTLASMSLTASNDDGTTATAKSVQAVEQKVDEFTSATVGSPPVLQQLRDVILVAESTDLRGGEQQRVVTDTGLSVDALAGQVRIPSGQVITLTARSGEIPVTLLSSAHYPIRGILLLQTDKLEFLGGDERRVTLENATNPFSIKVKTRTSGNFPVTMSFVTPQGSMPLATGHLTVRSTATSVVDLVLTIVAVAVLLAWWINTARKHRHLGRHVRRHDRSEPLQTVSGTGPEA